MEIVSASRFPLAYATDTVIATTGPDLSGSLAWTATRILKPDGSGEVRVRALCSSGITFGDGCITNPRPATFALAERLRRIN